MHRHLFTEPLEQKLAVTTGKTGCGKSTLLEAMRLASDMDPQIAFIDTSSMIRWHKSEKTEFGRIYDDLGDLESKGELYPAIPTIGGFVSYFRALYDPKAVKFICAAGIPRHPEQTELVQTKLVCRWRLVHIEISDPLLYRILRERNRPDDTPEVVQKKIDIYKKFVRPSVDLAEEKYSIPVLWINRQQPLRIKIAKFVEFTDWDPRLKMKILQNCRNTKHPAYKFIRDLDGKDKVSKKNHDLEKSRFETSNVVAKPPAETQHEPAMAETENWPGYHMAFPQRQSNERSLIPAGVTNRQPIPSGTRSR